MNPAMQPLAQSTPALPETAGVTSLEGLNRTVPLPPEGAGFWRHLRAFAGPAFLVSVGYMDPGNWGTDLAGGARFKYGLLWVVALASLMAIFLQVLSARLGIVTGKDLAQACRDWYPRWTRWPNWLLCELAENVPQGEVNCRDGPELCASNPEIGKAFIKEPPL